MGTSAAGSLYIRIDPRAGGSLQSQIYTAIRRAILDGIVSPGARLLSSRALAADLGVSRTTTLLAFEQLTAEGYLTARRGSGTFVARELPDDLLRARRSSASNGGRAANGTGEANGHPDANGANGTNGTSRVTVSVGPTGSKHPHPPITPRHPPLSRRGAALALTPPGARRVAGPPRAFRLGIPALDLFPVRLWTQLATRRLKSATLSQLDYGEIGGVRALREAIADHVKTARGTHCVADQVVVAAGAQRALDLICRVLLDPGDAAWLEEPGYSGARAALVSAGARILPARVDQDGLDVDILIRHSASALRAIGARRAADARLAFVTPSHQLPLGVPMTLPRRLALLRWATAAGAWIVEDDYDSEFRYGTRPMPCLHGLDIDGRVIYVGSFSKTLFPALRLGFMIVPLDLQPSMLAARRAADFHPPVLDQAVLADMMIGGHYDRHLRRMRAAYRERAEALADAAERCGAGVLRLRPIRTGLHAVADLEGVDATRVAEEALARGVEVMPLSSYYVGETLLNGLVIGFAAVPPDALRRGMERLMEAIEAVRRAGDSSSDASPRDASYLHKPPHDGGREDARHDVMCHAPDACAKDVAPPMATARAASASPSPRAPHVRRA